MYHKDMLSTRKPSTVLFVGFAIGFVLGIIILKPAHESPDSALRKQPSCNHPSEKPLELAGTYESWLASQGVIRNKLDIDAFRYGPTQRRATLESELLAKKVHITCIVFVEKEKNVIAGMQTWLKHCNEHVLYYAKKPQDRKAKTFSTDLEVKTIEVKNSWDFLCKVVLELWTEKKLNLQWLLFVSDSMFVVPENLRRMVAHLDSNDPYYFGHAQTLWSQPFNVALAGYVLSKGSVKMLAGNFTSETCPSGGKFWKKEDFYLGKNLQNMCVFPSDTRDESGKGRFHGYNLNQLLFSSKLALIASYWKDSIYPSTEGKKCCSDLSVTFQGIEADKMYMYDYIINNLHVFPHGSHGNQPAPTPYPPEQVWQEFMRSRGYSSVENVSAKEYFDAWKAKINEDLIKAGLKKKKHVWRGMDFKNGDGHGEVIPLPFQFESVLDTE